MWKVLLYSLLVFTTVLTVEHVCRINEIATKPSVALHAVANFTDNIFEFIGRRIADVSSFLVHLKDLIKYLYLDELWDTFCDITNPLIDFVMSPTWMVIGYIKETKEYSYPILIVLGSVLIVVFIGLMVYKFCDYKRMWSRVLRLANPITRYLIQKTVGYEEYVKISLLLLGSVIVGAVVTYCSFYLKE